MTTITECLPKIRAFFFPIFEKDQGRPPPLAISIYEPVKLIEPNLQFLKKSLALAIFLKHWKLVQKLFRSIYFFSVNYAGS